MRFHAVILLACGLYTSVQAAPAPWFYWRSTRDALRVCAQVSPGPGWEKDSAPFAGPQCTHPPKVYVLPAR